MSMFHDALLFSGGTTFGAILAAWLIVRWPQSMFLKPKLDRFRSDGNFRPHI